MAIASHNTEEEEVGTGGDSKTVGSVGGVVCLVTWAFYKSGQRVRRGWKG